MTNAVDMAQSLVTNASTVFQSAAVVALSIIGFIVLVRIARRILSGR
jgi:hypothetical protein